jgi:putative toxin-antitoxin system antitoxin component (TIGR02293 family)
LGQISENMKKQTEGKSKKSGYNISDNADKSIVSESFEPYGGYTVDPAAARTIGLMGMEGKSGFSHIRNENDFISVIRNGIPKQAMTHLMDVADITLVEMANIIHTTDRTLRRYTPTQKLPQEQSEGIVEMAMLYSRGEEVFGSMEQFKEWMNTVLQPFGNKKPKEFLDTSLGIGMIMDELGRIQHGIFA